MPAPRLPRVPARSPIPDTEGPEPSRAALDALWSKTRSVRVYAGGLGEHGPLARTPELEISGPDVAELAKLFAFDVSENRFRTLSLGECAFELRGRALRVGLLGVERTGGLRVSGWGSDVRLRNPGALFAWLAARGGPSLAAEPGRDAPTPAPSAATKAWIDGAPQGLAATAARAAGGDRGLDPALLGPDAAALERAEPDAGRRIGALLAWLGTRPDGASASLRALPSGILAFQRIADVLDVISGGALDEARRAGAAAYLAPLAGHGLVVERAARWPEALRSELVRGTPSEACRDVEGGRVVASSTYGPDLRELLVCAERTVALDGPMLVRLDEAPAVRPLAPIARLVGHAGSVVYGLRGADLVEIELDGAEARSRTIRSSSDRRAPLIAVSDAALYSAAVERRGSDGEPWSLLTREPLDVAEPERRFEARRGVVTALGAGGGHVLAVLRRVTRTWLGAPRARHELLDLSGGAPEPLVVHRLDTEPAVGFALAVGSAGENVVRAWLWSPASSAVTWVDLPSRVTGSLDAGAPVWGLGASGDGAWAVVQRDSERQSIVRIRRGRPPTEIGAFRAASRQVDVRPYAGGVYVAAYDKLMSFPRDDG